MTTTRRPSARRPPTEPESLFAEDVLEALYRWRHAEPERTWQQLADRSHVPLPTIKSIRSQITVSGLVVAKLYVAMGEPVTAAQASAYRRWVRRAKDVEKIEPIVEEYPRD